MAYTTIDDPSAHFQIATYSGSGGTGGHAIVNNGNSDLQPDVVWIKQRTVASDHRLMDSTRGGNKMLEPNTTEVEATYGYIQSFDTDGFTLGYSDTSFDGYGRTYVAYQWKANGGTTSTNTDGSITSTVQANQDAGFSIVTYTGTGANATIGHGLGAKPAFILTRSRTIVRDWIVRHHRSSAAASYYAWDFNNTGSGLTSGVHWTTTEPTTSVFSVGTASNTNQNTNTFVAFCFAEVKGFSMFGTYRGNNSANGPFVYTGFKPAFLIVKKGGQDWILYDAAREPTNHMYRYLKVGSDAAENATSSSSEIDFLSNGFKLREGNSHTNASGSRYQYYAFAENPFITSTGIPTTAR